MKLLKQVLIICVVNYVCYSNGRIHSNEDNQNDGRYVRQKRQVVNPDKLWDLPIKYAIDTSFNQTFVNIILRGIKHIEENTCVIFTKINENFDESFIVFTNLQSCSAFVGKRTNRIDPEVVINVGACFPFFGGVIRQLCHALGFFNKENRPDSRDFITVNSSNVLSLAPLTSFRTNLIQTLRVPYDYSSILHYNSKAWAKDERFRTIITNEPLFQNTIGQRTGLSFYDTKLLNLVYCKQSCLQPLKCKREGITLPPSCNKCICPDGYGGTLCETVGRSDVGCSPSAQNILPVTTTETCVQSPNYGSGAYNVNSLCNWFLTAPSGRKIQMRFTGKFSVYQVPITETCFHWVEIKFRGSPLETVGPRFCGNRRPTKTLISDGNEAVISFRSNFEAKPSNRRGFRLCYKLQGGVGSASASCSVPNTESRPFVGQCRSRRSCRFSCGQRNCAAGQVCCFKKKNKPPKNLC